MNIFVLDENPNVAAKMACDKHIIKMIVESAQLLCSSHEIAPYKRAFYNHPCSKWVRQSKSNYIWLVNHALSLCNEYSFRYGKIHKTLEVIKWCEKNSTHLNDIGPTSFAQAMPEKYKVLNDAVTAYRNYYIGEKIGFLCYTKRRPPDWLAHLNIKTK